MTKEQHIEAIPARVQRKRTKGWRMPENTVYVGRGSIWGNPFKVGETIEQGLSRVNTGNIAFNKALKELGFLGELNARGAVAAYKVYLDYAGIEETSDGEFHEPTELRKRNLACWCPLDNPCHADVLLEIANRPRGNDKRRVSMYLYSGDCRMCKCGQETSLKDDRGEPLYTGDIVVLCSVDNGFNPHFTSVVSGQYTTYAGFSNTFEHRQNDEYDCFIMGIKDANLEEWVFQKVKSYTDVVDGEKWSNFGFNYKSK